MLCGNSIFPVQATFSLLMTVNDFPPHETAGLVITHGGHGTVIKALAARVPLLILPHGRDQLENASRDTRRGAGMAISRKASVVKISTAITRILCAESYRLAAADLGLKGAGGCQERALALR